MLDVGRGMLDEGMSCEPSAVSWQLRPTSKVQRPTHLPRRLAHAGDHPRQRQLAEADAADAEAAEERARAAAPAAAVVHPHLELRLPLALLDHGLTRHIRSRQ